ncbi:MAG: Glu/Leu/Phe/Val dehydrogenase [Vicinamibacterales bacterium]
MSAIFDHPSYDDHEVVHAITNRRSGLRGFIAVHSTRLGPALGGTRLWCYPHPAAALEDVLRLSRGMTAKAALAGLPLGGGKAVLLAHPGLDHAAALTAYARHVELLGGRFITGEDVGITVADADLLHQTTRYVAGTSAAEGGLGDPSPRTAAGVMAAMCAALAALDRDPTLENRRVAVSGLGKVGSALCEQLAEAGAALVVADVSPAAVRRTAARVRGSLEVTDPASVHTTDCDVFAPCALGSVLHPTAIAELRCRAVVGSANNQLAGSGCAELLAERGVLYVPDYLANAGGLIQVAGEWLGWDRHVIEERTAAIQHTAAAVLGAAACRGLTPAAAADALVAQRLASAPASAGDEVHGRRATADG